ncbi:MAG: hypothetical protein K2J47_02970 [Ruminococcus sp.]|nr:hypothetical protein [Ruminococcus sp.]
MNEYKKDILLIIKQMESEIGRSAMQSLFDISGNATGEKQVGCNQFREIANDCRIADCYEEILLLLQYTEAKSKNDASWKTKCSNNKTFGEIVIANMSKVRSMASKDDKKNDWNTEKELLQMYFGYLYWQSRVWADKQTGTKHGGNGNIPNFNKNNNHR